MTVEVFDQALGARDGVRGDRPRALPDPHEGEPLRPRGAAAEPAHARLRAQGPQRRASSAASRRTARCSTSATPGRCSMPVSRAPRSTSARWTTTTSRSTDCRSRRPARTWCGSPRWPATSARSASCWSTTAATPTTWPEMTEFWTSRGIRHFLPFEVMNRGGALFVDEMQYATFAERAEAVVLARRRATCSRSARCPSSCCSSGTTASTTSAARTGRRRSGWAACSTRPSRPLLGPSSSTSRTGEPICKNCNHDPINRLTDVLRTASETARATKRRSTA